MDKHNERKNKKYSNEDIDISKSKDNVRLVECSSYTKKIEKEIKERYRGERNIRKDAVVGVETIFTSDQEFFQDLSKEKQIEFFKESLSFLEKKVGKQNIISAVIHYDETTPHLHAVFVPIDSKGKLRYKSFVENKQDLIKWQDEYYQQISKKFPKLERGKSAKDTKRKHLSVEDFKEKTELEKEKESLKKEINRKKEETQTVQKQLNITKKELEQKKQEVQKMQNVEKQKKQLEQSYSSLKQQYQGAERELDRVQEEVKNIESQKYELQQELKKEVEDFQMIQKHLNQMKKELEEKKKEANRLQELTKNKELLEKSCHTLTNQYQELELEVLNLQEKKEKLEQETKKLEEYKIISTPQEKDLKKYMNQRRNIEQLKQFFPIIEHTGFQKFIYSDEIRLPREKVNQIHNLLDNLKLDMLSSEKIIKENLEQKDMLKNLRETLSSTQDRVFRKDSEIDTLRREKAKIIRENEQQNKVVEWFMKKSPDFKESYEKVKNSLYPKSNNPWEKKNDRGGWER